MGNNYHYDAAQEQDKEVEKVRIPAEGRWISKTYLSERTDKIVKNWKDAESWLAQ